MPGPHTTRSVSTPADPPRTVMTVTPDDATNQFTANAPGMAFQIGAAGTLKLTTVDGDTVTYTAAELIVGVQYSLQILRVWQTGSTATPIKVYYTKG